jgi:hypothetical protein
MHPSMAPSKRRLALLVGGALAACAASLGCQAVIKPPEAALEKLLQPVATAPDSVTLEIFYARIPLDKDAKADAVWDQIDEQRFDAELRRCLVANGLRVGVVSGSLPEGLSELMELQSEASAPSEGRVITGDTAMPRVTRRVVQLNRREHSSIQASDVWAEAQVLISDDGRLSGGPFKQVQGVYSLKAETAPGQQVTVRLVPELHHGELRNRYAGSDQGIFLRTPSREKEVFDRLTMETALAPGDLLVLGCLPQAKASLGGVFHRVDAGGHHERKLILIRVLEVPPSEILAKN